VKEIEDHIIVLEVSPNVKIRVDRNSIYADAASNQAQAK
jgi:preprotein translocase subunit YajC